MSKSKSKLAFPRTVYKKNDHGDLSIKIRGTRDYYDAEIVEDEAQLKAAVSAGFIDDFEEAILGSPEPEKEDVVPEGDDEDF